MGMVQGADVSVGRWIYANQIPATIGERAVQDCRRRCCRCVTELFRQPSELQGPACLHPACCATAAGNWIGGAIMVGLLSAGIFGSPGARAWAAWERGVAGTRQRLRECTSADRRRSVGNVQ